MFPPEKSHKVLNILGILAVVASFANEGWSFFESSVAKMLKKPDLLLDMAKFDEVDTDPQGEPPMVEPVIDKCRARRPPPMTPDEFLTTLGTKTLGAQCPDAAALGKAYEAFFASSFCKVDSLLYDKNGWGDEDVQTLCRVLASVEMTECRHVFLSQNDFTDVGMHALASCLEDAAMPVLLNLHLNGHPKASFKSRDKIQEAKPGIAVHYDGMGGARTNHKV